MTMTRMDGPPLCSCVRLRALGAAAVPRAHSRDFIAIYSCFVRRVLPLQHTSNTACCCRSSSQEPLQHTSSQQGIASKRQEANELYREEREADADGSFGLHEADVHERLDDARRGDRE